MITLCIIVEGETEEGFVNRVLSKYLLEYDIYAIPSCYHGGSSYEKPKKHIVNWMKGDKKLNNWFTTMIDLYGLPTDFPEFRESKDRKTPIERVEFLEKKFKEDIKSILNRDEYSFKFIPYIQLHEFEALLFCDLEKMSESFHNSNNAIQEIIKQLPKNISSPEDINDSENTAPSKRIIKEIPTYEDEKNIAGPSITKEIGIKNLKKCPHFKQWIEKLEGLSKKVQIHD